MPEKMTAAALKSLLDAQGTLLEARERRLDAQASGWQAASAIDRILGDE